MKVIKKIILFVYNLIVGSIFKLLLWGLMAGVVFGVCIFFPPSHWINVLDSERLTEEQAAEIAPEITLKWATETSKLITREKAATVKAGTKVKVLGVFDVFAEGVLWHIYYDEAQYLIQLPDGSKVIAKLPEAAKLARAIVRKTGDTVNVLDVNKKKNTYSFKTSDGKVHKYDELLFIPSTLPIYFENALQIYASHFEIVNKVYKPLPKRGLAYVPTGIYKKKYTIDLFAGRYGKIIARGLSGVFDALLMILFIFVVTFSISRLLTIIPVGSNSTLKTIGGLLYIPLFAAYLLFVCGVSGNILILIGGLVHAIKKTNEQIVFHRCDLCHHAYKLDHLGKVLMDTLIENTRGTFHDTESMKVGVEKTVERDLNSGYQREIGSRDIYKTRSVSGERCKTKRTETWEHRFYCQHCKKYSTFEFQVVEKSESYSNVKKSDWR